MPACEAVTFDVWETLIHDESEAEEHRLSLRAQAMARVLESGGWRVDPERVIVAYRSALHDMEAVWAGRRDLDTPEQVEYVLRRLCPEMPFQLDAPTLAALADAYARVALDVPPELDPDAPRVLADVRARGLQVGLICNTGRTPGRVLRELFVRFGILDCFDVLAFSNEEGVRKPDPVIFSRVLGRLRVDAARSVHVGDDVVTDVGGAKASGMRAVLVWTPWRPNLPAEPDAAVPRLGGLPALLDRWS